MQLAFFRTNRSTQQVARVDGECSLQGAQTRSYHQRPFAQWNLVLLPRSNFNIAHIYRTALLPLEMFRWLCVCMVAHCMCFKASICSVFTALRASCLTTPPRRGQRDTTGSDQWRNWRRANRLPWQVKCKKTGPNQLSLHFGFMNYSVGFQQVVVFFVFAEMWPSTSGFTIISEVFFLSVGQWLPTVASGPFFSYVLPWLKSLVTPLGVTQRPYLGPLRSGRGCIADAWAGCFATCSGRTRRRHFRCSASATSSCPSASSRDRMTRPTVPNRCRRLSRR